MGIMLVDKESQEPVFQANFWHWRAVVEAVRSLDVLPESRVNSLHEPFIGELSAAEAQAVAKAVQERLLPTVGIGERILLDGRRTSEPDDGVFHRNDEDAHRNYSTNRDVLEKFAEACRGCAGFRVW